MTRRITRRRAITEAAALSATALVGSACGTRAHPPAASGSTVESTWIDPNRVGVLRPGPGESLVRTTDLAPEAEQTGIIATLAHVTDAHVLDASSPARATFLDRLGAPFESTFRPHETLTAQVLVGAINAARHLKPDAVIQGGDLIDNAQSNELIQGLQALRGGTVHPGSGPHGYHGVQLASDPDPFYYRPDLDAPRHPGLLQRATRPFASAGVRQAVHNVLGDHDILVQGILQPTPETKRLALGDQALWELPQGLRSAPGNGIRSTAAPDGPPLPGVVSSFIAEALKAPKVQVPADPTRRELTPPEVIARLTHMKNDHLDYHADIGPRLRLIVLDLARRAGGSGGLVRPGQPEWLAAELKAAEGRWVIVVSHQPLPSSEGGDKLLASLDTHPNVIAALSGHTHANRIVARHTPAGGYWLINTASLIDYPQQARALRIITTRTGVAIQTWMLDHVFPGDLGTISRQLSYLDAQGGRPKGFAGSRLDRNAVLYTR
jgi:hypothetical protein